MSLTVAIVVLNEQQMLPRALASAAFADEVLIVDGGSTDATVEIARSAGARVVERPFDDFARQRNVALEAASTDWVLFLDADERITAALADEVRAVVARADAADAYAIPRRNMALGRWLRWHPGGAPDAPVRLVRRGAARWSGQVHEALEGAASTGRLQAEMVHLTHRSVGDLVDKINRYSELEAAQLVARGEGAPGAKDLLSSYGSAMKSLWRSGLKREGIEGAIEACLLAFDRTLVAAKVWERTRGEALEETYRRADEALELPAVRSRNGSV